MLLSLFFLCALRATVEAHSPKFGTAAYSNHFGRAGVNATFDCEWKLTQKPKLQG